MIAGERKGEKTPSMGSLWIHAFKSDVSALSLPFFPFPTWRSSSQDISMGLRSLTWFTELVFFGLDP